MLQSSMSGLGKTFYISKFLKKSMLSVVRPQLPVLLKGTVRMKNY